MRLISSNLLEKHLRQALIQAAYTLDPSVHNALCAAQQVETNYVARDMLKALCDNALIASKEHIPLCQDTGSVVFFVEIGKQVSLAPASLKDLLTDTVASVWKEAYLRASICSDPLFDRQNTLDNTPVIIHSEEVPGDRLIINFALKGGGAENMSVLKMLSPSATADDIVEVVVNSVIRAGGNPCPPLILGLGIGGNFETSAIMAKKALFLPWDYRYPDERYEALAKRITAEVNASGVGVQGMGGITTVLQTRIISAPCHIASLPLAINFQCHAHRHGRVEI